MCIENIPDQPNKVTIIDEIANMDELYPYVFSGEGRTGKYIQIIVNPENKYYCLSQMELLKIKYIQYGIYFIQQKKKP